MTGGTLLKPKVSNYRQQSIMWVFHLVAEAKMHLPAVITTRAGQQKAKSDKIEQNHPPLTSLNHNLAQYRASTAIPLPAASNPPPPPPMLLNLNPVTPPPPPPLVSRVHSKEETEAAHDLLSLSQSLPPPPPMRNGFPENAVLLPHPDQPPTPPTPEDGGEHGGGHKAPQGRKDRSRRHDFRNKY